MALRHRHPDTRPAGTGCGGAYSQYLRLGRRPSGGQEGHMEDITEVRYFKWGYTLMRYIFAD